MKQIFDLWLMEKSLKVWVCVEMGQLMFDLVNIPIVTLFSSIKNRNGKKITALESDQMMTFSSHAFNCKDPLYPQDQ